MAIWVGIDVSKKHLDVCIGNLAGKPVEFRVKNDPSGFAGLLARCREHAKLGPLRFCMESTGGYEFDLACFLCEKGESVSVANPAWIKAFGNASGRRNKTDRRDACLIAEYASKFELRLWELSDPALREIAMLHRHRCRLMEESTRIRNWLEHQAHLPSSVVRQQKSLWSFVDLQLNETERELKRLVDQNEAVLTQVQALMRIPGMGPVLAIVLLCELGDVNRYDSAQQYAAQAGLCPSIQQSGNQKVCTRVSKQGNAWVRQAGWMAAGKAMSCNQPICDLSQRLKDKGLVHKQIRTAALRKLVMQAYGVLKALASGKTPFYPESTNPKEKAPVDTAKPKRFVIRVTDARKKARLEYVPGASEAPERPKRARTNKNPEELSRAA